MGTQEFSSNVSATRVKALAKSLPPEMKYYAAIETASKRHLSAAKVAPGGAAATPGAARRNVRRKSLLRHMAMASNEVFEGPPQSAKWYIIDPRVRLCVASVVAHRLLQRLLRF